jgi:Rrf2 family protein
MKISTKGRYALRLMLDLAYNNTGSPISLKDIARRQQISEKYLEQIIAILTKAGFVRSVRGARGGYMLKKSSGDYTVGMILRLTDGNLAPVDCVDAAHADCSRRADCVTIRIWEQMNDAINRVVDRITLEEMVGWQKEKSDEYSIS